jgi:carboxyl-terminal processing protease
MTVLPVSLLKIIRMDMISKKWTGRYWAAIWLCGLLLCVSASCEPEDIPKTAGRPTAAQTEAEPVKTPAVSLKILSAIDFICTGNFAAAQEVLSTEEENGATASLRGILDGWQAMQQRRQELRLQVRKKQEEKLRKAQSRLSDLSLSDGRDTADLFLDASDSAQVLIEAGAKPSDPNQLDTALATAIRLRDLAPEEDKGKILQDPFVRQAIEAAIQRAETYEAKGKWTDAYVRAYYWLTNLDEDNAQWREKAEQLTEMVTIELALKDGSCDDTVAQRYEDIKPEMFLRALQLLDSNYVRPPDYSEMIAKVFVRCRLLGRVLENSAEGLTVKVKPEAIGNFQNGIAQLEAEIDRRAKKDVTDLVQVFDETLTLNEATLQLPREVMIAQFTDACLQSLDPFTDLVWPWYVRDFEKNLTQQFSGIGVEISNTSGVLTIVSLLPDTPAYRAGLDADDEILAVNGEPTKKMTIFCAVSKITGKKGTKVNLTVRRPSTGQVKDYTIVRDRIVVQPIRGWRRTDKGQWDHWIDPANQIGYVRLISFSETSQNDLNNVLTALEKKGMKALILDLRYNSGGYLNSASEVADLFVSRGVIVKSNPRNGFATYEMAHEKGTHPDYPMAILINAGSASASEIVAGALQDPRFNRALLVGTRSYGKGSVQVVTPYTGGGSQLKYTIAYYHLPSDQQVKNRYQMEKLGRKDWGIAPDVEVEMVSHELRRMLDIQRDNDVLVQVQNGSHPERRHELQDTLLSDPQLSAAIFVIQAKMLQRGMAIQPMDPATWHRPIDPNEIY